MAGVAVLLLCLTVGMAFAVRAKSLKWWEIAVCGLWGLLIGGTGAGPAINRAIAVTTDPVAAWLATVLS